MIPIVVIGSASDARNIFNILSRSSSCDYVSRDSLKVNTKVPCELCVYSFDKLPKSEGSPGVAIFSESNHSPIKRILPDGFRIIACGDEETAEEIAADSKAEVITCGFSERDCLEISSNIDGSSVVSIKQNINTIGGNVIEPCDIVVNNSESFTDSILLLAIAALIICDKLGGKDIINL